MVLPSCVRFWVYAAAATTTRASGVRGLTLIESDSGAG